MLEKSEGQKGGTGTHYSNRPKKTERPGVQKESESTIKQKDMAQLRGGRTTKAEDL